MTLILVLALVVFTILALPRGLVFPGLIALALVVLGAVLATLLSS